MGIGRIESPGVLVYAVLSHNHCAMRSLQDTSGRGLEMLSVASIEVFLLCVSNFCISFVHDRSETLRDRVALPRPSARRAMLLSNVIRQQVCVFLPGVGAFVACQAWFMFWDS